VSEALSALLRQDNFFIFGFFVVPTIIGGIVGLVALVLKHQRDTRLAETEASLKRDMIAQGRPAEEIERILKATAVSQPAPEKE